jgi:hypothetical protein
MKSFREFIKSDLTSKLLADVRDLRIFNEADMQYRAAVHLDEEYYPDLYLTNQPSIPLGRARGTVAAKPDIVIYHHEDGPKTAIELKCFLKYENPSVTQLSDSVWKDVDKLRKFKDRYGCSKNAFAVVLLNLEKESYEEIQREFSRANREDWMSHYLFIHVLNVFCDENGRKRPWYNEWSEQMKRLEAALRVSTGRRETAHGFLKSLVLRP